MTKRTTDIETISADEYNELVKGGNKRRGKFNARPETYRGIRFDSQLELKRYKELELFREGRAITHLVAHPRFPLRGYSGLLISTYVADFAYVDVVTGEYIVEDVKSVATRSSSYAKNVKMLWDQRGIMTTEVLGQPDGSWIIRPAFSIPKKLAHYWSRKEPKHDEPVVKKRTSTRSGRGTRSRSTSAGARTNTTRSTPRNAAKRGSGSATRSR